MKKYRLIPIIFLLILAQHLLAQQQTMYRLILKDKGDAGYNIDRPEAFLTKKSIERRTRQGFPIDSTDLPIDFAYFNVLAGYGAEVRTYSKWVATVVVTLEDESRLEEIRDLPFISDIYPVWRGDLPVATQLGVNNTRVYRPVPVDEGDSFWDYGYGADQININNGIPLHDSGYRGEGLSIAVLDGGFAGVHLVPEFDRNRIIEIRDFTHEGSDPLEEQPHGTVVLSCMLSNQSEEMIGTAPMADYYLYKTEMNNCEFPVEEDYWIAAVEYADSIGIDIVTTSLGYFKFDDAGMDYTWDVLDGKTVPASRAASMAAAKGMILCHSAGNEGNKTWQKINVPSDADNILTVGALTIDGERSAFSALGYTADKRIKPDVMAMGSSVNVIDANGIRSGNGTSFSCPILAGLTACLWQALPGLNSLELMELIRSSSDRYTEPDSLYGYGIPDFYQAYLKGKEMTHIQTINEDTVLSVEPDGSCLRIGLNVSELYNARLSVYNLMGVALMNQTPVSDELSLADLRPGIYIASLYWRGQRYIKKFIRR